MFKKMLVLMVPCFAVSNLHTLQILETLVIWFISSDPVEPRIAIDFRRLSERIMSILESVPQVRARWNQFRWNALFPRLIVCFHSYPFQKS